MNAVLDQASDAGRGFELSASAGQGATARLSWGPAVDCAAGAAMALGDEAAWLDLLDDWLAPAHGLDWQPEDQPAEAGPACVVATALRNERAPQLSLPWALLQRLPAPPEGLGFRWPALPAELLVSRQPLPPEGLAGLVVGSVLLLEASFTTPWQGLLRRPGQPLGRAVVCGGRAARLSEAPAPALPCASPHIEVRLALPHHQPLPVLLGWTDEAGPWALDTPLTLHVCDGPERAVAEGQLLPWGRGHAMRVTRLLSN